MSDTPTLTIDMDKKCKRCDKFGATPSGYCLNCITIKMTGGAMQLHVGIKKVSTTKKGEGIDAQIVFEFIVSPKTLGALMDLMEMQGDTVILNVEPMQQKMFDVDSFKEAAARV